MTGFISGNTWIAPILANGRLYIRSQSGTLICFDVNGDKDSNGVPDAWETQYFGSNGVSPTADSDGDGWNNLTEYIAGTDPKNDNGKLEARIALSNGQIVVTYPTIRTNGPAYMGVNRYYNLENCTDLLGGAWQLTPGATNLAGDNSTKLYANTPTGDSQFYRVKVKLQ